MVQKSGDHHLGCIKPVVNNGRKYLATGERRISEPSTVVYPRIFQMAPFELSRMVV